MTHDINSSNMDVVINVDINDTCFRCSSFGLAVEWLIPGYPTMPLTNTNNHLRLDYQVVNGVLVMLRPRSLIVRRSNSYRLTCVSSSSMSKYSNIGIISDGKHFLTMFSKVVVL